MQYVNVRAEKDLIRYALLDVTKLDDLSVKFPPAIFSSQTHVKIYTYVLSHYDKFGKKITVNELLAYLDKEDMKVEDKENYYTLAKSLFVDTSPDQDFAFCKEEVLKLWRARSLMNSIKNAGEMIDKGDLINGERALRNTLDEPLFVGSDVLQEYELSASVDRVVSAIHDMKDHPEKYIYIPTGIAPLDDHLKGLAPAEVGLIVGKTAGFKSTALYNFAIESYMAGHDTMLITIEMSGFQILRRLYGRIANVEVISLDEASASKAEIERMREAVKHYGARRKNKLFVLDIPTGCTVDLLKAKIREYRRRCNLELVVVDYMQIMETRLGELDFYDWKALAIISKKLKETARQFNIAIWTAAQQISGLKQKKSEDSTDDIAFSKAVAQNVDVLIKISQTEEQRTAKEADLKVLKIRRKGLCPPIEIHPDPAFGKIHVPQSKS